MSSSGAISILAGRLGRAERRADRANALASQAEKEIKDIYRRLAALRKSAGATYGVFESAYIGTLAANMAVSVGKTIDGRDVSVDGATLDALGTTVTANGASITALQNGLVTGNLWLPLSAMSNRDAVVIGYSNSQEFGTLSATASGASRFGGAFLVPADFESGTTPDIYLHHLVAAAGGTNGQDVVMRITTGTAATTEATGTNGVTSDITIDVPNATTNIYYRSQLVNDLANVTALDLLTILVDRRGADAADTFAAATGLVGIEMVYTRNVS